MSGSSHKWRPIEDLSATDLANEDSELPALVEVWNEWRTELERRDKGETMMRFDARLRRTWAIETGVIERLYDIDRGTTQILVERGLDAALIPHGATDRPSEAVVAMIRDQHEAVEGLFAFVKGQRLLSTSYIKELHAALTRHQPTTTGIDSQGRVVEIPLRRGEWKRHPNNPTRPDGQVHEYCPPEQVASEMDRLVTLQAMHMDRAVPAVTEAAWLHHRFTQIHPFQDGNGRVARCLATLVMIKAGAFPLVVTRDQRTPYLDALEHADGGCLVDLVQMFVDIERRTFVQALGQPAYDERSRGETVVADVITAAAEQLVRRNGNGKSESGRDRRIRDRGDRLCKQAVRHFESIARDVGRSKIGDDIETDIRRLTESTGLDGRDREIRNRTVRRTADAVGHVATRGFLEDGVLLELKRGSSTTMIMIALHGVGPEFSGLAAIGGSVESSGSHREELRGEDRERLQETARGVFTFNAVEDTEPTERRFTEWLEHRSAECLALGLRLLLGTS